MSLENIIIVDTHVHPFNPRLSTLTPEHLAALLAIGGPGYEPGKAVGETSNLIVYRYTVRRLARLLGVSVDSGEVLRARNLEASKDLRSYVSRLFSDAGIAGLIIDDGHSEAVGEHALPMVDLGEFEKSVPGHVKLWYLHRLEPDIAAALSESSTFNDFVERIEDVLESFARNPRYVGFKTIIAYRVGLAIEWGDEARARKDFGEVKQGKAASSWFGPLVKSLREYVVSMAIEKAAKHGKAVQVHTGIGDKDIVLDKSSPIHIFGFLKDERARRAKIILVHGGYPWTSLASYLVNAFPNVYMDLSIATPFGLANLDQRIRESLELAPYTKVMYASDGYYVPEIAWISAVAFREALSRVLRDLEAKDIITETEAADIAEAILYKNAERVYNIEV
ncbi:MAG: amidohydrolase family protein [Desulfurococcales archaeon]|nr:amidohydrolase family protein [Desulfurococcales archaeon]